jgi:dTDP-4-amino-4,6-dideoxygalactose transaminase
MIKFPLFKVNIDANNALKELEKVLNSGFLNEGEQVTELSNLLKKYFDIENVVLLNSCTSALTLALKLSGVDKDTEVITTSMTCVASNTPIHNLGAKIVWADIDYKTGNIDPDKIESLITDKTKAVLCVNWAGLPCDLIKLQEICKKHNIKLIQDAAHSFGAKMNDKHVCHISDFTCYSFQAIKHFTTGDGGALICKDQSDFERAKKLKWFGIDRDATKDEKGEWKGQRWGVDIEDAGYKFHMNNITAAIGISQFKKIESVLNKHIENANIYQDKFKNNELIKPLIFPSNSEPTFWVYTIILDQKIDNEKLIEKLNEKSINAGLVHTPNHLYSCFKEEYLELKNTDYFYKHQISLPCGWWLDKNDIEFISETLIQTIDEILS